MKTFKENDFVQYVDVNAGRVRHAVYGHRRGTTGTSWLKAVRFGEKWERGRMIETRRLESLAHDPELWASYCAWVLTQ